MMETYLFDWVSLLVRWLHMIAGIAWIGASFYFVWLDNHLRPVAASESADAAVSGELWAVHGGGFYRAQKYRVAPAVLPPTLHWFYWEAYTTWLSGFALLCVVYFMRADAYLIDPSVAALSPAAAIAIALAFIVGSWLLYDGLCRSPLGRNDRAVAGIVGLMCCAMAWGLCHLFSGRGAFMIFGAALGSIMVANVLFVIIPGQRELVHAKQQGRPPDPTPGLRGKQRSVHNTYFTLPVLFVMMSNHYAMTYGASHNWVVLIAMSLAGACIRAWFVARHRADERGGRVSPVPAMLGGLILIGIIVMLSPTRAGPAAIGAALARQSGVALIVEQRCQPCHARNPTEPGFDAPPNGLVFETIDQVRLHLPEVQQQLATRVMPLGNLTGMTEAERARLLTWIARGAPN